MNQHLEQICKNAYQTKVFMQTLDKEMKNHCLRACARQLISDTEQILAANKVDYDAACANGMSKALLDRLLLTPARIENMAEGLNQLADLPDPVGNILDSFTRPNGLKIEKVSVPFGVIGIIYEARPNVTADAFGICFKAGSCAILKGGSDCLHSNIAIVASVRKVLKENAIPEAAVSLIEDTSREITAEFMKCKKYVDVLIPRGGAGLIRAVVENSTIPVIETGTGNCHIYIDKDADTDMVIPIIINAKTQRIGVCNACESLVIHEAIFDKILVSLNNSLKENHVEVRADERIASFIDAVPATEEDFGREYLDYILSMKTVSNVEEAIAHINKYSTGHSDCILTTNEATAQKFLNEIDSACVYWNASTRFTDGFEFGFGAEIGISTQKLHARGPMGLKELTSYKYKITGTGQVRG